MLLAQGRYKNTGYIDVNDNFNQTSGHSAHAEHKQTDKVPPMKTIEIIIQHVIYMHDCHTD